MTSPDLPLDAHGAAPFDGAAALRAAHLALLDALERATPGAGGEAREHDAVRALSAQIESFLVQGVAAGALIEEPRERSDCQVLLDYWGSMLARAGLDLPAARLAPFDAAQLPTLDDRDCPYVGLESFRDATYFFGRERDSEQLVGQIRQSPLVVVLGASGSGKSSLVLAGALPRLRAETRADGGPRWCVAPPFTPGDAVVPRLLEACAAVCTEAGAAEAAASPPDLGQDPARLAAWLDTGGRPVVLTFDQFEEVFTLAPPEDRELLSRMLAAVLQSPLGHRVVLTMREEFRTAVTELRALEPWLGAAWFQVSPMGYDALRAAVEKPAALAGLRFQPGVVDDLVKRMLGQPAALPLLQFTLQALWRLRDRNRITRAVYERLGDPLAALKTSADAFYAEQAPETQAEVRRVLLALVRIDDLLEAYRQPVRRGKLLAPGRASTDAVIDLLQAAGYVRVTAARAPAGAAADRADDVVEIRHEALIRNWPRLVDWIDDERRSRRQRLVLLQAAQRWAAGGRPDEGLLTGWQLQEAQRLDGLTEVEREFVAASAQALDRAHDARVRRAEAEAAAVRRQLRQEVRLRQRAMGLIALAVVVIAGLSWWAWHLSQVQDQLAATRLELQQSRTQQEATARRLAALQAENDRLFARQVQQAVEPAVEPAAGGGAAGAGAGGGAATPPASTGTAAAEQAVTVYLHISDERQRTRANQIAVQLQKSGIVVPGVQRVDPVRRNEVRYFREADARGAEQIAQLLSRTLGVDGVVPVWTRGYETKVRSRQYELWFAADALGLAVTAPGVPPPAAPAATTGVPPAPTTTGRAAVDGSAAAPRGEPAEPRPPPASATPAGAAQTQTQTQAQTQVPAQTPNPSQAPAQAPVPAAAQIAVQTPTQAAAAPAARAANPHSERQRVELLVYRLEHGHPARSTSDLNRSLLAQREWAQSRAQAMNIRSPLGLAVLYDSAVSLGLIRVGFVRARSEPAAGGTASERAWLLDFLKGRERPAINPSIDKPHERQRLAELRRLIEAGQWDLADERPASP